MPPTTSAWSPLWPSAAGATGSANAPVVAVVRRRGLKTEKFRAILRMADGSLYCKCGEFASYRIPCEHILCAKVSLREDLRVSHQIDARWKRKTAVRFADGRERSPQLPGVETDGNYEDGGGDGARGGGGVNGAADSDEDDEAVNTQVSAADGSVASRAASADCRKKNSIPASDLYVAFKMVVGSFQSSLQTHGEDLLAIAKQLQILGQSQRSPLEIFSLMAGCETTATAPILGATGVRTVEDTNLLPRPSQEQGRPRTKRIDNTFVTPPARSRKAPKLSHPNDAAAVATSLAMQALLSDKSPTLEPFSLCRVSFANSLATAHRAALT